VPQQLEIRIVEVMANVRLRAGKEVVDAEDVMPRLQQPVAQVGASVATALALTGK